MSSRELAKEREHAWTKEAMCGDTWDGKQDLIMFHIIYSCL